MTGEDPAGLWAHAVEVYGRPGVDTLCLELQDRHGADVNVVLWCLWVAERGIRLDEADVDAAAGSVSAWSAEVVQPLRRVRRWLKVNDPLTAADRTDDLRTRVAAAEIDAERLEMACLAMIAVGPSEPSDVASIGALATANIERYLDTVLPAVERDDRGDLVARLVAAAIRA